MSKFDEVKIAPPDMRCEERKREAEFLKQASSEDLKKMFDQVKQQKQEGDLKMTADEAKRIEECIGKPEFVDLFHEYVSDISDPKNMEEYDAYIRQLEEQGEIPESEEIIRPEPGFCVKARSTDVGSKTFINCAGTDRVPEPSVKQDSRTDANGKISTGGSWSIPYIYTSFRMDRDKSGTPCQVFDILFNSRTLKLATTNPQFKALVVQTALESLEENAKLKLKNKETNRFEYTILKNCRYKGSVVKPHKIKKDPQAMKTSLPKANKAPSNQAVNLPPPPPKANGPTKPKISYVHRGEIEFSDCMRSSGSAILPISRRPKELVVKLELPLMVSIADMQLEIKGGVLEFDVPGIYMLREKLPYPVVEDSGDAKYNKTQKLLTVTLAVKPWSQEEIDRELREAEVRRAAEEEARARCAAEEEERHKREVQRAVRKGFLSGDAKGKKCGEDDDRGGYADSEEKTSSKTQETTNSCNSNTSGPTCPRTAPEQEECGISEKLPSVVTCTEIGAHPQEAMSLRSNELVGSPGREGEPSALDEGVISFRQNDRNVTVVVRVESVEPGSVEINYFRDALRIRFAVDAVSCNRRQFFSHQIRLAGDIEPSACRHDTSKANLVIVLRKAVAESWKQFTRAPDGVELAAAAAAVAASNLGAKPSAPAPSAQTSCLAAPGVETPSEVNTAAHPEGTSSTVGKGLKTQDSRSDERISPSAAPQAETDAAAASCVTAASSSACGAAGDGVEDGSFCAAAKFEGSRPGFVFKAGPRGLGYYADEPPQHSAAEVESGRSELHVEAASCAGPTGEAGAGTSAAESVPPAAAKDALPGLVFTNTLMFQLD